MDLKNAKLKLFELRYNNIQNEALGHTGISNAIQVDRSLKLSSILSWNGLLDSQVKLEIIQWRLGRIAYHQPCLNCHRARMSRQHALACSGMDEVLYQEFKNIGIQPSHNLLDSILNHLQFERDTMMLQKISLAIQNIKEVCLHNN